MTSGGVGPAVVGIDIVESVAYAIHLREEGAPLELLSTKVVEGGKLEWRSLSLIPEGKRLIDVSRFVRDKEGHVLSLVTLESNEGRLFTHDRNGKVFWGESFKLSGAPIRAEGRNTILMQTWVVDGYLITRYPTHGFESLGFWAYLLASL